MEKRKVYNKIRYLIQNKKSFRDICLELNLSDLEVMYLIECINEYGIPITISNREIVKHSKSKVIDTPFDITSDKSHLKIGFLGDTHLASISDDIDSLNQVYDIAEDKQIDYMFHCGDLTEGVLGIPNFEDDLKEDTYFGQVKYVIDRYPRYSGKTYIVAGNHDDYWTMLSGREIISDISSGRSDIIYLGGDRRLVNINGLKIQIMHGNYDPITNGHYNISKYIKQIPILERPHILHFGHKHTSYYDIRGNTHLVRSGSIMNNLAIKDLAKIKNEKAMFFADINLDNNGLPIEINIDKTSFSK